MDKNDHSDRPEQASLEPLSPGDAEINSKRQMDVSVAQASTLVCPEIVFIGSGEHS